MINIQHLYSTHVDVTYLDRHMNRSVHESTCGTMDDIAEEVCQFLVRHGFDYADVCSAETGELLITVDRS